MGVFIDSADLADCRAAKNLGWIAGITTNPTLLARESRSAKQLLIDLAAVDLRPLFYQLQQTSIAQMLGEAEMAEELVSEGLVLKLPPNQEGFRFAALHHQRFKTCVTAVFSPSQAVAAAAASADYVAIYVNRATRQLGDGMNLVRNCAAVLSGTDTSILAASLKTPEEAVEALVAGADHLTAPLDVLTAMMSHPSSQEAMGRFMNGGIGLNLTR